MITCHRPTKVPSFHIVPWLNMDMRSYLNLTHQQNSEYASEMACMVQRISDMSICNISRFWRVFLAVYTQLNTSHFPEKHHRLDLQSLEQVDLYHSRRLLIHILPGFT